MLDAVNKPEKQRGRPFNAGQSGNPHGRPKGARNKRTRTLIEAAQAGGELPLDYMLAVMRDPKAAARRRDEMAKAAAPYLHSKLAPIEPAGGNTINGDNKPLIYVDRPPDETAEQWEARQRRRLSEKPAVVTRTPVSSV